MPNNYLYYIDRKSQAATPLCNKPNCSHNSVDCNAYFNLFVNASGESANVVQYYDGNLYIVVKDEDAMGNFLGNILYKVTPDGSTREKLIEFKDGISHWLIHKGYFYFSQDKFADDIDSSSVYDSFSIKRYKINNIKSKPEEIFNSKITVIILEVLSNLPHMMTIFMCRFFLFQKMKLKAGRKRKGNSFYVSGILFD